MTVVTYPIVGAFHRPPAQAILNVLGLGTKLWLRAEPTNFYDPNAIAVWLPRESFPNSSVELESILQSYGKDPVEFLSQDEFQLGYIPREIAAQLSQSFPRNQNVEATFSVSPSGKPQLRLNSTR